MSRFNFFGNISGENVVINGNDVIINGKQVNNPGGKEGKEIDEIKKATAQIKKLYVTSNVRVNIYDGNDDVIVARLHGTASSKDFQFDVVPNNDSLRITANIESSSGGITIINDVIMSGSFNNLQLDIVLPRSPMEIIIIQSKNSSISVERNINVPIICAASTNGSIKIDGAIFRKLQLECKNGSIRINSHLYSDVELDITNQNGSIDCALSNVGISTVEVCSKNGHCKNSPVLSGKYTASGSIFSKNGSVKFH